MTTKKINLIEFKSILKDIINEEMMKENSDDVKRIKAINKLSFFAGSKKDATKMVDDYMVSNEDDYKKETDGTKIASKIQAAANLKKTQGGN